MIRSGADLQPAPAPKAKPAAAIWDEHEVVEGAELDDIDDPRPQPEYTINFRQTVTSEDVFLQVMCAAAPDLSCCRVPWRGAPPPPVYKVVTRAHMWREAREINLGYYIRFKTSNFGAIPSVYRHER